MSVRGNTAGAYFGEWFGPVDVVPGAMLANIGGSGSASGVLTAVIVEDGQLPQPGGGGGSTSRNYVSIAHDYHKEYRKRIDRKLRKPLPKEDALDVAQDINEELQRSEADLQQSMLALQSAQNAMRLSEIGLAIAAIEDHIATLREDEMLLILALSI